MKKIHLFIPAVLIFFSMAAAGQSRATIEAYVIKYRDIAVQEMQRTGVPAAITLAQGIHETGAGTSDLVVKSNNHFGIKCKTEWTGERVYHDDDAQGECFRKYTDPAISYQDHSDFLKLRPNYTALFQLDPTDYEAWAYGLKKAGYATNPRYPEILIKLIRDYNLQDYTLIALGRRANDPNTPDWAKTTAPVAENNAMKAEPKKVYPEGIFKINDTKVMVITQGMAYLKVAEEQGIPLSRLLDFNDLANVDIAATDGLLFLQRKRKAGAADMHIVMPGETVYAISQAEGLRLESLLEYNFLTPNVQPAVGEKLYLSVTAPSMPRLANSQPVPVLVKAVYKAPEAVAVDSAAEETVMHTVAPKETLYSISKKYGVSVEDIKSWNHLAANDLKTGQQLKILKATQ